MFLKKFNNPMLFFSIARMYSIFLPKNPKKAFSLVEMLMALLVASLLLAALAPVMTRKFSDSVNVNANNTTQSKGWRLYTYSSDCTKAEGEDNVCEFKDFKIPKGVYSFNLIMSSAGGGGAGATSETTSNTITVTKTTNGVKTDTKEYDEQIIPITEYMTNVKLESLIGGGGGGGGGSVAQVFIPSSVNCQGYGTGKSDTNGYTGTNFATYDTVGLCVTKFNQRTSSCYTGYTNSCGSSTAMDYVYSGCSRAVCSVSEGKKMCSNMETATKNTWRLPNADELAKWSTASIWKTLALCDYHTDTQVSYCNNSTTASCGGYYCFPMHIVSKTLHPKRGSLTNAYLTYYLQSGNWLPNNDNLVHENMATMSVRCVYDGTYALSGAGGGSGSTLSNIDLSNYIKQAGTGGQIILRAGRGGAGGAKGSTKKVSASNGNDGYRSCIYVQKKPISGGYGDTVYAMCAYEGKGGNAGNISTGNAAVETESYSYCREYINGSWKDIACSVDGGIGGAGSRISGPEEAITGGNGAFAGLSDFGSGGNGGSSMYYSYNTEISTTQGSNGTGGIVKLTYQNEFKGAGGGGGAGGTFAKITNLSLSADTECVIKVGGGGNYGSGQNGKDGGDTSIKCGNSKEYIVYGGKGGKLGTSGIDTNNPNPVGGKGGDIGKVSENIIQLGTLAEIIYGEGNSIDAPLETLLKINGNLNIGGNGGKSGNDAIGGCGGLRPDDDIDCTNESNNATLAQYITPVYTSLIADNPDYGKAGAGGGGGGWSKVHSPKQGIGSSGQPGYLFLWWDQK